MADNKIVTADRKLCCYILSVAGDRNEDGVSMF